MSGVQYGSYLKLDNLLSLQTGLSKNSQGKMAREEMLFIVAHQTHELWFKQILWDLDEVFQHMSLNPIPEDQINRTVQIIRRIHETFDLLVQHISVLETMTPMEFLEFRDLLSPASGFQSAQFRIIENKIGLKAHQRISTGGCPYHSQLSEDDKNKATSTESSINLFDYVNKWLNRTPMHTDAQNTFWTSYVENFKKTISKLSDEAKEQAWDEFNVLVDSNKFEEAQKNDHWRFDQKALQGVLYILYNRHQPDLIGPYQLIENLRQLDRAIAVWRLRHAQMARYMIGERTGTGGSPGADYLQKTVDAHRVFKDFSKLNSFLI